MSCLSAVASPLKTTMGNVHKYTKTWPGQIRISFHWPVSTLREIWPRFWRWPHVTPPYLIINGHIAWFYDSIIQASGLLKRTCFSLRRYTAFKRSIAPGRSWYLVSTIIGTNFAKHSASNCCYVGQGLCKNKVHHRHVRFVFLPNPPIAILELPNCLRHEWLTFLKRCYWLVRPEYNKHVTMKALIFCINQNKNI